MLQNIEFRYPGNSWFFVLAIVGAVIFVLSFRKKEKIMARLHLAFRSRAKVLRGILYLGGLGLMTFSLLGPQAFEGTVELQKTGMDIYILIDTSKSMLTTDIQPDRISVTKKMIGSLLDSFDGDRVGFIPFSSDAYIQMPLTDDYRLARMFLDVIDTDMISGGGTNLEAAIQLANRSFERASDADRVILIFSDGEEQDGDSQSVLQTISDDKLRVYTIGLGTEKGGLIPVYGDDNRTVAGYMKDGNGNPVTSRLQPITLMQLAKQGGGAYYQASMQGTEVFSLINDLSYLQKGERSVEQMRRFEQLYPYFLGAGLLLFITAWALPEKRRKA